MNMYKIAWSYRAKDGAVIGGGQYDQLADNEAEALLKNRIELAHQTWRDGWDDSRLNQSCAIVIDKDIALRALWGWMQDARASYDMEWPLREKANELTVKYMDYFAQFEKP